MGNCLVTKLKSEVQNDNLTKLGDLNVEVLQALWVPFKGSESVTAKNLTQNFTTPSGTDVASGTTTGFIASAGDKVVFNSKYNLITMGQGALAYKMQIADLEYMSQLTSCKGADFYGNLADIKAVPNITTLEIKGRNLSGSLANLAAKFPNLTVFMSSNSSLSGTLEDLGTLIYLTELQFADYTRETSTIESFVAAQRTARVAKGLPAGNSTGIVMKYLGYSDVTFEGTKVTSNEVTLKWTTDSITLE